MSLFESWLVREITVNWRRTRQPMRASVPAGLVGKHDRTMQLWLVQLEKAGKVRRVGQRGGWLPVGAAA